MVPPGLGGQTVSWSSIGQTTAVPFLHPRHWHIQDGVRYRDSSWDVVIPTFTIGVHTGIIWPKPRKHHFVPLWTDGGPDGSANAGIGLIDTHQAHGYVQHTICGTAECTEWVGRTHCMPATVASAAAAAADCGGGYYHGYRSFCRRPGCCYCCGRTAASPARKLIWEFAPGDKIGQDRIT